MSRSNTATIYDSRIDLLSGATGWSRYFTIGYIHVWHSNASRARVHRGTRADFLRTVPPHDDSLTSAQTLDCLTYAGYVRLLSLDDFELADIAGDDAEAIRLKRQAAGRKGGHAKAARRPKKTETPKPAAPKREVLALVPKEPTKKAIAAVEDKSAHWNTYADAYFARYGIQPLRTRKTNSQMKTLREYAGQEMLHRYLQFYLSHPDYTGCYHDLGAALTDFTRLRGQMERGTVELRKDNAMQLNSESMRAQQQRIWRGDI